MATEAEYIEIPVGDIGNTQPKKNLYRLKLSISSQKFKDLEKLVTKKLFLIIMQKNFWNWFLLTKP